MQSNRNKTDGNPDYPRPPFPNPDIPPQFHEPENPRDFDKKFIRPSFRDRRKRYHHNEKPQISFIFLFIFGFFFIFGVISFFVCLIVGLYFALKKFNEWYLKKQEEMFKELMQQNIELKQKQELPSQANLSENLSANFNNINI